MTAVTADPTQADVATQEATTSTSYTDLATSGPAVASLTLTNGQVCLVILSARMWNTLQDWSFVSFAVSGATALAASDANAVQSHKEVNYRDTQTRATVFTATAAGAHTFTMKYKCGASGSAVFSDRRIIVKKF
jgi:hypothetical protein